MPGTPVNDSDALEHEADVLGAQALKAAAYASSTLDQLRRLQARTALITKDLKAALSQSNSSSSASGSGN